MKYVIIVSFLVACGGLLAQDKEFDPRETETVQMEPVVVEGDRRPARDHPPGNPGRERDPDRTRARNEPTSPEITRQQAKEAYVARKMRDRNIYEKAFEKVFPGLEKAHRQALEREFEDKQLFPEFYKVKIDQVNGKDVIAYFPSMDIYKDFTKIRRRYPYDLDSIGMTNYQQFPETSFRGTTVGGKFTKVEPSSLEDFRHLPPNYFTRKRSGIDSVQIGKSFSVKYEESKTLDAGPGIIIFPSFTIFNGDLRGDSLFFLTVTFWESDQVLMSNRYHNFAITAGGISLDQLSDYAKWISENQLKTVGKFYASRGKNTIFAEGNMGMFIPYKAFSCPHKSMHVVAFRFTITRSTAAGQPIAFSYADKVRILIPGKM